MIEAPIRQPKDRKTIESWITKEFEKQNLHSNDLINTTAWFLDNFPMAYIEITTASPLESLYEKLSKKNEGKVIVNEFVKKMVKLLLKYESKIQTFSENLKEAKEIFKKVSVELNNAFESFSKAKKCPQNTTCSIKLIDFQCEIEGSFLLFLQIGKIRKTMAEILHIKFGDKVSLDTISEFIAEVEKTDEKLMIELFQGRKRVAMGEIEVFGSFSRMVPTKNNPIQAFETIELEMYLEQDLKKIAIVKFEITYHFSPMLFHQLQQLKKNKYAISISEMNNTLKQTKFDIQQISEYFPQIKFDYHANCFFEEEEEYRAFRKATLENIEHNLGVETPHESHRCDCCYII